MTTVLISMIVLAVIFDFLNGIHDSSNIVATMIASRAFSPRVALGVTAISHFIAPFIFGVAVATTIGHEVVAAEAITINVLLAALVSAIIWNLLTWFLGIPSSSSHALVGGMIGAVGIGAGFDAIELQGMEKILLALFISPILGLLLGFLFTRLIFFLARGATPKINTFFKRSQIVSAIALSLSHGTNDAQKTMGIITLGLVVTGVIPSFEVPLWVITISAGAIALGTALGGWKLIKTLGSKFYKIRPVHGFSSQLTSAFVILGASIVGGPVSTTQVVSSSIMGVGSADRVNMVRWGVAKEIMIAWLVTIPATAVGAAGLYWIGEKIFG
ncbi:MAG: inorganic phosphate transporter [Anaerolineales bacterium]|uniref:Inorganic phosphate transporter n=1 Tax=Candidatus Desulfolinea nitratireducens TaxID=2841698 RepID=A0A8J6NFM5_9CHLR|nr:inorganic phosphate transporter [Candidatus Desulfolinea nitratireducens]